ncbi:hypothetical protein Rhopal_004264-T1 [Rhodotorula paludigena]|uniref:Anaphase-promoting complex subunit 5 n=1 Tax=Rhodotorula paludigena TaxID=86838 RepID=A0AAV5GFD4_9BASI|nr:hypothetical protein Rhopal_004264-T1 [Rhodotorula paludigena]
MQPGAESLGPAALATVVLVYSLLSSPSSLSSSEPHRDVLAAYALECTAEHHAPPSLDAWVQRGRGTTASEAVHTRLGDVQLIVKALRADSLDGVLQWFNEVYVRRTALTLGRMSFDETRAWWTALERWCDGTGERGEQRKSEKRRRAVPSFARARLQQDYQSARELVRTFAPEGQREPTSQQALLHLALIEFEDGGFGAARMALHEATQVARSVGDTACLAALQKRLDAASGADLGRRGGATAAKGSPHDVLWELSHRNSQNDPLDTLFPLLCSSLAAHQHLSFPPPAKSDKPDPNKDPAQQQAQKDAARVGLHDPDYRAQWHAAAAGLWEEMGLDPLARVHESLALEFVDPHKPTWDVRLAILARQARRLSRDNRPDAALGLLLSAVDAREKRVGMGRKEVGRWRDLVWEVEVERARRSGHAEVERMALAHHTSPETLRTLDSPDPHDASAPLYTRLTAAATWTHLSTLSQRERARLSALARLATLRVAGASEARAEAERGLRELEEAWGAVLALEEGETEGEQGEGTLEAREARARAAVVACMEDDSQLPPLVEELSAIASGYLALSHLPAAQRVLLAASQLADHLLASPSPTSPDHAAHFRAQRDALAQRWLDIDEGRKREGAEARERREERWERLRRVVDEVERAVEVQNR